MEALQMARRALRLEWVSIGWIIIEATGALWAGVQAHSVALTGFGADSLIEQLSAGILVQRLTLQVRGGDAETVEAAEHRAARWAAGLLGLLALYLVGAAAWELFGHLHETASPLGMILAAVSVALMVWLARSKRVLGQALGSAALQADAAESVVCAWMAATALVSLAANWAFHWTWVDPLAALLIAYWVVREAREAWEEAHEE
ncbi:MAG: cation transporter [Sulfobacillus thermosulfidooxidans]|uniref:Cation efflux family protein n=2 Tax=Sulfobacillus thermosulfidooxidans TaxID=28034 RepID=A0A1W1WP98_SULTA|nr:cation transporter [Sulfobacillus thermosulfidooxidans]PSR32509.1 MAG: cation transporter [Sulfobacillus thermosulfidooxidans]SMC08131.1 Cation efflux family protein [Sulfobacillus thermosulfidooxidans DSM 9293]